jgi:DNA repair photolyase
MVSRRTNLPILGADQQASLRSDLADPVEYRKSGLSLNHVIGCPLDCAYCVRHLFDNFEMRQPQALMSDAAAVEYLIRHRYFTRHRTPLQLFNRATDPFLSAVKPHTFTVLEDLDGRGLQNHVLIITRYHVTPDDCRRLNSLSSLKVTLLFTYSGIEDARIEPVASDIAARSLRIAYEWADRYRALLYWRPIVPGLNDSDEHIRRALELSRQAHATVFTGLFYRDEIRSYYRTQGLPEPHPDVARRKILPESTEAKILAAFAGKSGGTLFRKTSCGVCHAHGLADYNGHYGVREVCDICPADQISRCAASHRVPTLDEVSLMANRVGSGRVVEISERAVVVDGFDEQQRYYMQHAFGFQFHDVAKPHRFRRHGRAEVGWEHVEPDHP